MENAKSLDCTIKNCSICARGTRTRDAIENAIGYRLLWKEPPQLIAAYFDIRLQDLSSPSHALVSSDEGFPYFENFQFLFEPGLGVDRFQYLKLIEAKVSIPQHERDRTFCKNVGSLAGYFRTKNGLSHFFDYENRCAKAMQSAKEFDLASLPSFLRSEERIREIQKSWLLRPGDREDYLRIRTYGNGAVALNRIGQLAFVQNPELPQGHELDFNDVAKTMWENRIYIAWRSLRIWDLLIQIWRSRLTNPKTGNLALADLEYFLLRITDAAILAAEETKQPVPFETRDLQNRACKGLKKRLSGLAYKHSKRKQDGTERTNWFSAIKNRRSDLSTTEPRGRNQSLVLSEEIKEGEIPLAISKALAEDREKTPGSTDWWEKSLAMFEERKPATIITRVDRDLIDVLFPNRKTVEEKEKRTNLAEEAHHVNVDGDEMTNTLPAPVNEATAVDQVLLAQQIENSVCHSERDHVIWQGRLEGKTLEVLAAELNISKSMVGLVFKGLKQKARLILRERPR
jgi:hypothetical protein